jgi:hypothetical protein
MDSASRLETCPPSNTGQFPSSFPETFKDFFSMINEDEDHVEVISNILEDKVNGNCLLHRIHIFNVQISTGDTEIQ